MLNKKIKVGDVLVGSYGYEARLSHFYEVVKRTPKQVVLVELRSSEFDHRGFDGWSVAPTENRIGEEFRRSVKVRKANGPWNEDLAGEYVRISDYMNAYPWDGKAVHNYCWH